MPSSNSKVVLFWFDTAVTQLELQLAKLQDSSYYTTRSHFVSPKCGGFGPMAPMMELG